MSAAPIVHNVLPANPLLRTEFAEQPAPIIKKADAPAAIVPACKAVKKQTVRLLCATCNKIISGPKGHADFVVYIQCIPCNEAAKRAERARMLDRLVACKNCGSKVIVRLDETDKATTIKCCSRCNRGESQPKEGATFAPKGRVFRDGKRIGFAEPGGPRSMGALDLLQYQDNNEAENDIRKHISSPLFVEGAKKQIQDVSIRELQKQFGIKYESARQGKIGVLKLKVEHDRTLQPPPAKKVAHRKPRKCPHGVTKHRNDRAKSRHCSVCYPNIHAHLVNWKSGEHDAAIKSAYLASEGGKSAIKELGERFRMSQYKIRQALKRAGIVLEEGTRESARRKKRVVPKDDAARLAHIDQEEEFGAASVDPQIAVTN